MSSATERNEKISKLFKLARQKYQPAIPQADRKVLEHLIYACLLEDSTNEAADEVFARLQLDYFDWNEVRVTTTVELAELMKPMASQENTANRLRRALHGMFEAHYSFDLEFLKKENLGKAIEQIGKYRGMTPFSVAYVTQHALGGHSIPLDHAMMNLMMTLGIVDESELESMKVTGLERVVSKNEGIEFASVVHQLAIAWANSPFNNDLRALLKKIAPDAADRFPKRGGKTKSKKEVAKSEATATEPEIRKTETKSPATKSASAKKVAIRPPAKEKKSASSSKAASKPAAKKKVVAKKAGTGKKTTKRPTSKKLSHKKPR